MSWAWVVQFVVVFGLSLSCSLALRRWQDRRGPRAGQVMVSVRSADPGGRWTVGRARRDDGQLVLQPAGVHDSAAGRVLHTLDAEVRPVSGRDRLRVVTGATELVRGDTTAGPVEIAGSRTAVAWLREQLPGPDDR